MVKRALAMTVFAAGLVFGQSPEFEVASVRPSGPDVGVIENHLPSLNVEWGRNLNFTNITLRICSCSSGGHARARLQQDDFVGYSSAGAGSGAGLFHDEKVPTDN
jgi:hypothetical protein